MGRSKRSRTRLFESGSKRNAGLPPGTPVHVGSVRDFKPFAVLTQYHGENFAEIPIVDAQQLAREHRPNEVSWINVEGIHDIAFVQKFASYAGLHPLTIEDIANSTGRPKFESYGEYYFFVLKMLYLDADGHPQQEHISIVLKGNDIYTFQESPGDTFNVIRDRIRNRSGQVRTRSADYLVYMMLDSIVDGYYQVVDRLGERIDALEEELRCGPQDQHLGRTFEIRREILLLRKNIMPVRDLLNKVQVDGTVFQENTKLYLKDLTDHIQQVVDFLNLSMDMSKVLIDTYHSMQNQRMNAVMKTLTMISTVFLPLNFIAGVYGMNFEHMPELKWEFGYPMALGAMFLVMAWMVYFFVRKGWLLESRVRQFINPFHFFEDDEPAPTAKNATSKS
ncbi:MAG: magnesium/cobalt transporter CorA [Bdellovibrionota bacterium]